MEDLATTAEILDSGEAGGKIIRGGAVRTAAYIGGILVGLVSTPFLVRHLGVDDFGRYIAISSLIFIVAGLTEGGLGAIGVREYSTRDDAGARRLMGNLLGIRVLLTIVGVALATGFALAAGYDSVLVVGTLLAGAGLLVTNYFGAFYVPLTARLRLGLLAGIDLLRQGLTAALIVGLVIAGASLVWFFGVPIAVGVMVTLCITALVRRWVPLRPRFERDEWVLILRDSIPYAAATAVGVLYFRVAVVLMSVVSTEEETGIYSLAFRVVEIVSGVPWLLVAAALPVLARAARADADRMRYTLQRLLDVALILGVWVALSIGLGAPFAVEVVGGSSFEDSVPVLAILGGGMVGTFLVATWGHGLISLRRNRALLVANASALAVGIALTLLLVPPHGAIGGAIATTATELWLAGAYV
ncbi:MAG: oligosaccharide flippase family protein, partial [Actinomycetota bacterium]|nr:oligosaccharide flippase family protein [Actinomycetota bacterium]